MGRKKRRKALAAATQTEHVEATTCSVCYEAYTTLENKEPVVLCCGHTFCRTCILGIEQYRGFVHCPMCNKSAGTRPAHTLPRNYSLAAALEVINSLRNSSTEVSLTNSSSKLSMLKQELDDISSDLAILCEESCTTKKKKEKQRSNDVNRYEAINAALRTVIDSM